MEFSRGLRNISAEDLRALEKLKLVDYSANYGSLLNASIQSQDIEMLKFLLEESMYVSKIEVEDLAKSEIIQQNLIDPEKKSISLKHIFSTKDLNQEFVNYLLEQSPVATYYSDLSTSKKHEILGEIFQYTKAAKSFFDRFFLNQNIPLFEESGTAVRIFLHSPKLSRYILKYDEFKDQLEAHHLQSLLALADSSRERVNVTNLAIDHVLIPVKDSRPFSAAFKTRFAQCLEDANSTLYKSLDLGIMTKFTLQQLEESIQCQAYTDSKPVKKKSSPRL